MKPTSSVTAEILEEAALRRQRQEQGEWSVDDDANLEVWLQADDRHAAAFEMVDDLWRLIDEHAASPELIAERRASLGRFEAHARKRWSGPRPIAGMSRRRLAVGLAAAAAVGVFGVLPLATQGDVYRTKIGERRVVQLQDGSVLSLDAMSRVSVRYSKGERRLTLERGQARFDVAHDSSRPFTVIARDRRVVATGTAFNIDMISPEVRVTLIEGRVLVTPVAAGLMRSQPAPVKPVELQPGQALVADAGGRESLVEATDVKQAVAWQQGQLIFQDEPLGRAVERVNRYTDRKIIVADARAAAIPVSGAFNAGDVNAFLEALDGFIPVHAAYESDQIILHSTQGVER